MSNAQLTQPHTEDNDPVDAFLTSVLILLAKTNHAALDVVCTCLGDRTARKRLEGLIGDLLAI